jgi:CheY-specific phosphatase CheX
MTDEPSSSSPASASTPPDADVRAYMQVWAESLSQVLGQVAGSPFAMEYLPETPADVRPPQESDLRVILVAAGALRGEMSLRIPREAVLALAQLFLSEARDAAAEFKPDHQEAVEELLRQVAGLAATALKPRWGEVQLAPGIRRSSFLGGGRQRMADFGQQRCFLSCAGVAAKRRPERRADGGLATAGEQVHRSSGSQRSRRKQSRFAPGCGTRGDAAFRRAHHAAA